MDFWSNIWNLLTGRDRSLGIKGDWWKYGNDVSEADITATNFYNSFRDFFSDLPGNFGNFLNDATGTTAANQFAAEQALLSREHATAEREASQIFNAQEAEKARRFQEQYDASAVQRRMSDLEAAGVNPMLAFMGSSASLGTSSGSTAASSSGASSANASAAGNSASAVSGIIRALASLVKAAK